MTPGPARTTRCRPSSATRTNPEGVIEGSRDDGLWNGYTGTGYMDMGGNVGDAFEFDVDAPEAGTYSFTFRYVNADSGGAARPLSLLVGGTAATTIPFDITGAGTDGWTNWTDVTVDVALEEGANTVRLENTIANGPNIDSITITREGAVIDDSADEDGNLALAAAASVAIGDSDAVEFTLTGVDADIVTYEVSTDNGTTFTEVTPVGGVVTLDLSGVDAGNTADVLFRLTDDAGNTVDRTASVDIVADPVGDFEVTLQLEARNADEQPRQHRHRRHHGRGRGQRPEPHPDPRPAEHRGRDHDRPSGIWDGATAPAISTWARMRATRSASISTRRPRAPTRSRSATPMAARRTGRWT